MKSRSLSLITFCGMLVGVLIAKPVPAAEIITVEDFKQDLVMKDHLVKVADNAIFLLDGSESMNRPYQNTNKSMHQVALEEFKKRNAYFPDLGHNMGLYLYDPWKSVYPMQPYDRESFAAALNTLPAKTKGVTKVQDAFLKIDPILKGLSGKTVVFLFTDGAYTHFAEDTTKGSTDLAKGYAHPRIMAKRLTEKYDVCFYLVSSASEKKNRKFLKNIGKVNACSRVVPFDAFIDRPEFNTGALFTVRSSMNVVTTSDKKVVGLKADNIQFEFDQAELQQLGVQELDEVGQFLRQNDSAYIALEAFTDNVGSKEYNQLLSRRRAQSVADYLQKNHAIDPNRLVTNWYGDTDPIASNDTADGRAQNRRVEMAIGGL